jgi:hypothetical protein
MSSWDHDSDPERWNRAIEPNPKLVVPPSASGTGESGEKGNSSRRLTKTRGRHKLRPSRQNAIRRGYRKGNGKGSLRRVLEPMYEALKRPGAAWRFRRDGKRIYTAQLACAHCCTMFQLDADYSAGTFSVATEENLAIFLLVEHTAAMQLRPEEWSH